MKFYGLLDLLPGPVTYYDVQKLYSISYDDGTHRCALEHAIDELKIEKSRDFTGRLQMPGIQRRSWRK